MELIKNPIVSVIIPTYNASLFITETISSVLAQSVPEFEIIVVDDSSTDDTIEIIQGLSKIDERIRYFIQKKSGVSVARNRGIKESLGKYIAFIDHDDLWVSQKLEKQLKVFNKDSQLGLVFSRASIMATNGGLAGFVGGIVRPHRGDVFRRLLYEHFIPVSSVVIKREVFNAFDEWFVESMELAEEADLFLRIAYVWKVDYCDEALVKWRMHSNNDSTLRRNLLVKDYSRIIDRLKEKIPNFEKKYKREIIKKQRWIAMAEIEILVSKGDKKPALKKALSFLRNFGFYPIALIKFFILFTLGFYIYEKLKSNILNLCNRAYRKIILG